MADVTVESDGAHGHRTGVVSATDHHLCGRSARLDPRRRAASQAGKFDVAVVLNWKRFARNARNGLNVSHDLEQLGVSLGVVEGEVDTGDKQGRFIRTTMLGVAELDHDALLEQMAHGQRGKARRGGYTGGSAPYGWKVVWDETLPPREQARSAHFELNEDEVEWLRLAADWMISEGIGFPAAAKRLAALGVVSRTGRPIHPETLRDTMRNPAMKGEFRWGGGRRTTGKYGEPIVWQHEQHVISPERFHQLQAAVSARKRPDQKARVYPLGGGLLLAVCGEAYGGWYRSDRGTRMYRCRGRRWHHTGAPKCGCAHLPAEPLEGRVWNEITCLFTEPGRLVALADEYLGPQATGQPHELGELAKIRRKIAQLETSRTTTVVDYAKAGLPVEAVKAATDAIEADLAALRVRAAQLQAREAELVERTDRLARLEQLAERAARKLANANPALQAEVLWLLDVGVTVIRNDKAPPLGLRRWPSAARSRSPTGSQSQGHP